MTPDPLPSPKPVDNPRRSKLPPARLPANLAGVIASAFESRTVLEASGAPDRQRNKPMWELTAALCEAVPVLAAESGEVAIRLCELPVDATAEQVWDRVRTAPRADMWEYSREHHQCVRVGDWRPLWP